MGILIDKSILIYDKKKLINFDKITKYDCVYMSAITMSELLIGVHLAKTDDVKIKRMAFVEYVIKSLTSLPFDDEIARVYSIVSVESIKKQTNIGYVNMIIAATAIRHGYPVLTFDMQNFDKISGLDIISAADLMEEKKDEDNAELVQKELLKTKVDNISKK